MMRISRVGILTERGFTLIEILTVLFLIGVLLGLLAPHIHHQTQELPAAGLSLIGTVREAYTQAVATRQSQSLCMDLTRGEYWVEAGPCSPVGAVSQAGPASPHRHALSLGVQFLDVQTAQHEIVRDGLATVRFFPIGRAERGVIHLEDRARNQLSLLIHPLTGMVSAREGYVTKVLLDGEDH